MAFRYFIENNKSHTYLAFDAAEMIRDRIAKELSDKNLLVKNGQIRHSVRRASDGQKYQYFTRVRNKIKDEQLKIIFHNLERPSTIGETLSKLFETISDIKLENRLIRLALEIREKHPVTPEEAKKIFILNDEMISWFLSKKPTNMHQFTSRISPSLRLEIGPIGGLYPLTEKYLKKILSIIQKNEESFPGSASAH